MTPSSADPPALDLPGASRLAQQMRVEIRKAFVGQDDVVDQILVALFAGGHVLIEGVPGLGKTLLVRALAQTFGGDTSRIQFTPDLMPADVIGHVMYEIRTGEMRVRRGPVFTHLLLADEINRAPAKTQAALLEVMQERQVTLEGDSMPVPTPFMTLATQNPVEQEGTYPLPEAQLDRFLMKIQIAYPSEEEERQLTRLVTEGRVGDALNTEGIEAVASPAQVEAVQAVAAGVTVDVRVHDYAVKIARATREWGGVSLGASPRGSIALVRAARANALLLGRHFVTPEDVKFVTGPALRHRLLLTPEVALDELSVDDVLRAILDSVEAPRV